MRKIHFFNKRVIKNNLRWLAILPVAIGTFIMVYIFVGLFFLVQGLFIDVDDYSGWYQLCYNVIQPTFSSMFAVYLGTLIAPARKKIISLILGLLMVAPVTYLAVIAIIYRTPNLFWFVAGFAFSLIAVGYVVYKFFTKGDYFEFFGGY